MARARVSAAWALALIAAVILAPTASALYDPRSPVRVLTASSLNKFLDQRGVALVEFFAPWVRAVAEGRGGGGGVKEVGRSADLEGGAEQEGAGEAGKGGWGGKDGEVGAGKSERGGRPRRACRFGRQGWGAFRCGW